jgi:hypothetical protein
LQRASAEDVQMKVEDRLTGLRTVVDNAPKSFPDPFSTGDLGRGRQQSTEQFEV